MDTYRSAKQAYTLAQQQNSQSVALNSVAFRHPTNGVMIINGSTTGSGGGSNNARLHTFLMGVTGATFTFRADIAGGCVGILPFLCFGVSNTTASTSASCRPAHVGLY